MSKESKRRLKKDKPLKVKVLNEPIDVNVASKPYLVTLFAAKEIDDVYAVAAPGGVDIGAPDVDIHRRIPASQDDAAGCRAEKKFSCQEPGVLA